MKKIVTWAVTVLVICAVNFLIISKENTLAEGKSVLVKLAPVDPRSLMQGDYMILRYAMAREVSKKELADKGHIVISLDENNVAKFVRVHDGETLQDNEQLLFYRNRGGLRLGAESFFFQEGDAKLYDNAEYGLLKVDASGKSVLAGLCGKDYKLIEKKLNED